MTRQRCLVAVACVVLSACNRSAPAPQSQPLSRQAVETVDAPDEVPPDAVADYVVIEPIQHQNLTIFPVLSKTPQIEDPFITLDEGLRAGTVEIREVGARVSSAQRRRGGAQ